ncbi:MAG: competence/damage-inducible protein A [Gammaproteobacteria bacterium]|nr:competence/damage-inducible protein A [Gammaproteobacteria bacterium]
MTSLNPSAALVIIGNEILSGRTQDANLAFLGRRLAESGISLDEARVVADETAAIVGAVNELRARHRYVFTSGGIGPTHDDITTASIAAAFGVGVIRHPDAVARMRRYYGTEELSDARLRMADVPTGAALIDNPVSAAPGYRVENVYVFAGVPRILQAMFETIVGELAGGPPIRAAAVSALIRESTIAAPLEAVQLRHPRVAIGSYPFLRAGVIGTTLVVRSADAAALDAAFHDLTALIDATGAPRVDPD